MIMKKKEEKIENKIYEQRKAARDTHTAVYIHANVITHNQSEFELMQQFIYIRRASEWREYNWDMHRKMLCYERNTK